MMKTIFTTSALVALVPTVFADTQTYTTLINSNSYVQRQSSRITSATAPASQDVNNVHMGITFAVSASALATTTISLMTRDGIILSSTTVAPSNSQVLYTIPGPQMFKQFKVSPTTALVSQTIDVNVIQSQ